MGHGVECSPDRRTAKFHHGKFQNIFDIVSTLNEQLAKAPIPRHIFCLKYIILPYLSQYQYEHSTTKFFHYKIQTYTTIMNIDQCFLRLLS